MGIIGLISFALAALFSIVAFILYCSLLTGRYKESLSIAESIRLLIQVLVAAVLLTITVASSLLWYTGKTISAWQIHLELWWFHACALLVAVIVFFVLSTLSNHRAIKVFLLGALMAVMAHIPVVFFVYNNKDLLKLLDITLIY